MKLVWMKSLPLQCLSLVAGILNFTESHLWPHPKQVGSTCYVWRVQVTNKTRESPKIWIPKCWPEWSTWCHGEIFEMLRLYHTRFKTIFVFLPIIYCDRIVWCASQKKSVVKKNIVRVIVHVHVQWRREKSFRSTSPFCSFISSDDEATCESGRCILYRHINCHHHHWKDCDWVHIIKSNRIISLSMAQVKICQNDFQRQSKTYLVQSN